MNAKWKKTGPRVYETEQYEIRGVNTEWGMDWRLFEKNPDAVGGLDWMQSYQLLRDAKEGAAHVARIKAHRATYATA